MEFPSAQRLKSGNSRSLIFGVLVFGPGLIGHECVLYLYRYVGYISFLLCGSKGLGTANKQPRARFHVRTRRLKSFPWDALVCGSIMAFYLN